MSILYKKIVRLYCSDRSTQYEKYDDGINRVYLQGFYVWDKWYDEDKIPSKYMQYYLDTKYDRNYVLKQDFVKVKKGDNYV